jgi:hypothetical protein
LDLNVCRENITVNELVFNGTLEHSVELDYMLPDYCPNIFQVLKSSLSPKIISTRLSGSKLTIDGIAFIRILYVCEENNRMHQIEQKQAFTKTLELKEDCTDGTVSIDAKCDFLNCRAVNQRRLDIRGAVTMKTVVSKPKAVSVVQNCDNLQMHHKTMEIAAQKRSVTKEFTVKELLETGHSKPPIQDILNYEAHASTKDYKILANKIICKGEISLHTLYCCSEHPERPEVIEHAIPISQIVDFDGIDESCQSVHYFEILEYDIDLQVDDDGECRSFQISMKLRITCEMSKNTSIQLADDCFSTGYEMKLSTQTLRVEQLRKAVWEQSMFKNAISLDQNQISYLYDILYEPSDISWKLVEKEIELQYKLKISILALNSENMPVCMEESVPCTAKIEAGALSDDLMFLPNVQISSLSYNISSVEELELRGEIEITGMLYESSSVNVISELSLDEEHPKQKDQNCALRIYFAEKGETVWEIAKRYSTSVTGILEQNALESETVPENSMIFIPMVD